MVGAVERTSALFSLAAIATAREVGKKGSLHKEGYGHKARLE